MIKVFQKDKSRGVIPQRLARKRFAGRLIFNIVLISAISCVSAASAFACACGCGIYSAGTPWTMCTQPGASMYLQYSYQDQNKNWHGQGPASPDLNNDKDINTSFYTLGAQYLINRSWGVMAEVPFWDRYFRTSDDSGNLASIDNRSLGDVRLFAQYTGFSPDMSTAVQFGLKLPTGPHNQPLADRDTQIGTGTTDILIGAYHLGQISEDWGWYVQGLYEYALNKSDEYRPGDSFNSAVGVHYDGFVPDYRFAPLVQLKASLRARDSGEQAHPDDTGYQRLFVSPGFQVDITRSLNFYADVAVPVYTHVNGFQLVAPFLVNTAISYKF